MNLEFKPSEPLTLGIELEIQLIDPVTLELKHTSTEIIEGLKGIEGTVKHEFFLSNLELNTPVCKTMEEAERWVYEELGLVMEEARRHDTLVWLSGTHPFSPWREQRLTDKPRYRMLAERLGIVSRRFNIFGLHVHVGIGDGQKCIDVMNRILYYLPHLLALSVNSPFWEGELTGLHSYRTKVLENLPIAGLPFYFKDWDEYKSVVNTYLVTETITTIREIWWDMRPHPDFGTLEFRICDMPLTVKDVLAITSLIQALVRRTGRDVDSGIPYRRPHSAITRENKWRAARYGLDGRFITADGKGTVPIRRAIEEVLSMVEEDVMEMGTKRYVDGVVDILSTRTGSYIQMEEYEKEGNLKAVVRKLSQRLEEEVEGWRK